MLKELKLGCGFVTDVSAASSVTSQMACACRSAHEAITEAADRLDYVVTTERFEDLAKAAHVDVDGSVPRFDVLRPCAAHSSSRLNTRP